MRDEVVPVAAAMQADPSSGVLIDQVFEEIRTLHAERMKDPGAA